MFAITTRRAEGVEDQSCIAIECPPEMLDDIRRLAVDGFNAFSHGGLETGGVLYGIRETHRIVLISFAELPCDHSLGPGFVLSESDRDSLSRLIQPPPGLETVGWFRAHTRRPLEVDSDDRAMFDTWFAQPGSIVLLLKPSHWGPVDAAFFVQDDPGQTPTAAGNSFTIGGLKTVSSTALAPIIAPQRTIDARPLNPKLVRKCAIGAAILVLTGVLAYRARPSRKLDLQVRAISTGQVRIQWNQGSKPMLDAASGVLEIKDGESSTKIPLDRERLRSSTVTYTQVTGRIIVRLLVMPQKTGAPLMRDAMEFVGPPAPVHTLPGIRQYALSAPMPQINIESTDPNRVEPPAPSSPPIEEIVEKPRRTLTLPATRSSSPVNSAVVLPPPPVSSAPAATNGIPDFLERAAPAAAPALPTPPKSPIYTGPSSGRLIWTGSLARRGVIEIEGAHASVGSLLGGLPGVPLAFRVLPSEFGRQGLVAYTADSSRAGRTEPPSKSNGWNGIHFELDAARAEELVVLEAPNETNAFSRLVVRNDGSRAWSMVVIDWSVR